MRPWAENPGDQSVRICLACAYPIPFHPCSWVRKYFLVYNNTPLSVMSWLMPPSWDKSLGRDDHCLMSAPGVTMPGHGVSWSLQRQHRHGPEPENRELVTWDYDEQRVTTVSRGDQSWDMICWDLSDLCHPPGHSIILCGLPTRRRLQGIRSQLSPLFKTSTEYLSIRRRDSWSLDKLFLTPTEF